MKPDAPKISYKYANNYWPSIPFHDKVFFVSSLKDLNVDIFIEEVKMLTTKIMDQHATQIPLSYKIVQQSIRKIASTTFVTDTTKLIDNIKMSNNSGIGDEKLVARAVQFLHDIGQVVVFKDRICLDPSLIPKVMAKFISPQEVRETLLGEEGSPVEVLNVKDIGMLLRGVSQDSPQFASNARNIKEELEMMIHFGVCFKMGGEDDLYLFPSLGEAKGVWFFFSKEED